MFIDGKEQMIKNIKKYKSKKKIKLPSIPFIPLIYTEGEVREYDYKEQKWVRFEAPVVSEAGVNPSSIKETKNPLSATDNRGVA